MSAFRPGDICLRCGGDALGCACGYEGDDGPPLSSSWPDDEQLNTHYTPRIQAVRRESDREQWEQEHVLFPWLDGEEC